jgi:hypothetical protein
VVIDIIKRVIEFHSNHRQNGGRLQAAAQDVQKPFAHEQYNSGDAELKKETPK